MCASTPHDLITPRNTITMATTTMKALNYLGPYKVRVEDVEKPKMEHPDDIIVKVTTVSDMKTLILDNEKQTNPV